MDRGKFSEVAPNEEGNAVTPKNPYRNFKRSGTRAKGRSGKGAVKDKKRSTYHRHGRYAGKR